MDKAQTALRAPQRLALFLIKGYQAVIRPYLPMTCRFYPSCSAYACEAILKRGLIQGGFQAVKRLCRCHPWAEGGVDLV